MMRSKDANQNKTSMPGADGVAQRLRSKAREDLRRECIAAHEHFKQTGLHLTREEVEGWLDRLAVGEDVEPSACLCIQFKTNFRAYEP